MYYDDRYKTDEGRLAAVSDVAAVVGNGPMYQIHAMFCVVKDPRLPCLAH